MRIPILVALALGGANQLLAAQTGSRYLPIGSAEMVYVEHLIRAGVLRDPDPLTRPLRREDVARALAAVSGAGLHRNAMAMLEYLERRLAEPTRAARWSVEATAGFLGASDARRWAERPSADSAALFPFGAVSAAMELPHLVLVTNPGFENRLRYDPDYTGKKDRFVAGRMHQAYVLAGGGGRYAELFFGRADRNWGSPEVEGLLLSPVPYSFDHLFLRLGPRRLRLELLAAQLDPLTPWDGAEPVSRFLAMHRLVVTPSDRVSFSLQESAVYAATGGLSRSWEPWYLNPLAPFLLAQYDDSPESNALVGADVTWRAGRSLRLYAQLYLDDFQVDKSSAGDLEPPGYGFTLAASGGAGRGAASWSALYTRVTNLAYRTPNNEERYSLKGAGIGRNFADYDQLTARATALAAPSLLAGAELTLIRQGEGDFRLRYPEVAEFPVTPTLFAGTVERTVRLAAAARWMPREDVTVWGGLGRHIIRNAGHVAGASDGRWVWRLGVQARRALQGVLRW